jgi:hypothetical protein
MPVISRNHCRINKTPPGVFIILLIVLACPMAVPAENEDISKRLEGFDPYMDKILKDWNAPGVAVGSWPRTNSSSPRATATANTGRDSP